MAGMRLTAAKSSVLSTKTGAKRRRAPDAPLLPSDLAILKNLEHTKEQRASRKRERSEKLKVVPGPVSLEWQAGLGKRPPLMDAVKAILGLHWKDMPLPDRKGSGRVAVLDAHHFRGHIPSMVMTTHLYSIFVNNSTHLEREIRRACTMHLIRRFVVNIIEGGELIILAPEYDQLIDDTGKSFEDGSRAEMFNRFKALMHQMPSATSVSKYDLDADKFSQGDRRALLNSGFLTIIPGQPSEFNLSIPSIGSYLRLVSSSRKWVHNTLSKMPHHEALESALIDKWDKNKFLWKDFKGANVEWVLCDCYGGGWCEPFKTPVGRGWKLTGKAAS